jgi:fluoride exporter
VAGITPEALVWVALGSALGGIARFFLSGFVGRRVGETFPWGTMTVNVTGAFAIGIIAALATSGHAWFQSPGPWQFGVTGLLGAYTTVSSFSLQTLALAREAEFLYAAGNVLLSLVLCLAAVIAGFSLGTAMPGLAS